MRRTHPLSRWQILRAYLVLPHAVPVIAVMIATFGFALVASEGWPGLSATVRLLGAMLGAQMVIGTVNDLIDADLDGAAGRPKPIPSGMVTRQGACIMISIALGAMVVFSASFGQLSLLLCTAGTATGIAYSLWFKRTIWSWIPYLIALPLLPIWIWVALAEFPTKMLALYPVGLAAAISVQIAQSLPDIERDQSSGVQTLAVRLGDTRSRRACWGAMLGAAAVTGCAAQLFASHPGRAWLGAVIAVSLVLSNIGIWRRDHAAGVQFCFPLMAAATITLGIGWTASLAAG
jgi:4-hydroxybenzoate polyprenyltransferase